MATIMKIGGGSGQPNVLTVFIDTGATVTATGSGKVVSAISVDGKAVLKLPKPGVWSIFAELDGMTTEETITIIDEFPVECNFGVPISGLPVGAIVKTRAGDKFTLIGQNHSCAGYPANSTTLWSENTAGTSNYIDSFFLCRDTVYVGLDDIILDTTIENRAAKSDGSVESRTAKKYPLGLWEAVVSLTAYGKPNGLDQTCFSTYFGTDQWNVPNKKRYVDGVAVAHRCRDALGASSMAHFDTGNSVTSSSKDPSVLLDVFPVLNIPNTTLVNPEPNADGTYSLVV